MPQDNNYIHKIEAAIGSKIARAEDCVEMFTNRYIPSENGEYNARYPYLQKHLLPGDEFAYDYEQLPHSEVFGGTHPARASIERRAVYYDSSLEVTEFSYTVDGIEYLNQLRQGARTPYTGDGPFYFLPEDADIDDPSEVLKRITPFVTYAIFMTLNGVNISTIYFVPFSGEYYYGTLQLKGIENENPLNFLTIMPDGSVRSTGLPSDQSGIKFNNPILFTNINMNSDSNDVIRDILFVGKKLTLAEASRLPDEQVIATGNNVPIMTNNGKFITIN